MSILPFPLRQVREESYTISRINGINEQIEANEKEISRLAHANWLLRLEREGHEEKLRG